MAKADLKLVQSKDRAKIRAQKGGIASGKARREKRTLRLALEQMLTVPDDDAPGQSNLESVAVALIKKAAAGDVRAFLVLRETIGQKPQDEPEDPDAVAAPPLTPAQATEALMQTHETEQEDA